VVFDLFFLASWDENGCGPSRKEILKYLLSPQSEYNQVLSSNKVDIIFQII